MRKPRGQLRRHFATAGLLKRGPCLGFLGHVHRQDVDAIFGFVGGEGHANAPGADPVGKFERRWITGKRHLKMRQNTGIGIGPQRVGNVQPDDL